MEGQGKAKFLSCMASRLMNANWPPIMFDNIQDFDLPSALLKFPLPLQLTEQPELQIYTTMLHSRDGLLIIHLADSSLNISFIVVGNKLHFGNLIANFC